MKRDRVICKKKKCQSYPSRKQFYF